jgi:rod shape-determining protein MreC
VSLSSSSTLRFADGSASPLRLLAYLAIALMLMTADTRGGWLRQIRQAAAMAVDPLYWLASTPARMFGFAQQVLRSHDGMLAENAQLRRQLLVATAREHRLQAVIDENQRLRALLGGTHGMQLGVRLASIIEVDLDPSRQRVELAVGSREGVQAGQALIDSAGLLGQVVEVTPLHASALLVTDPDHAVPVQVVRTGLRLIAYGTGERDRLEVRDIPQSGDIQVGDKLVTSGIGGHFPAGFPVGSVRAVRQDESRLFAIADLTPAAAVDRSNEVLLVWVQPVEPGIGPPVAPEDDMPAVVEP